MTKPSKPIQPRYSSKTYSILKYLLVNEDIQFSSLGEAHEHVVDELDIEFNAQSFGQLVRWYNEGLYIIDGVHSSDQLITLTSRSQDQVLVEDEETLDSFDDRCRAAGIDPSDTTGGWIKTSDISVRVNKTVDDVNELNNLIDAAMVKWEAEIQPRMMNQSFKRPTNIGVLNIADLHLGAYVQELVKTPDYSSEILCQALETIAERVNRMGYDAVHVNILGDLIESLGMELAHSSMWKEMENGIYGFKAIKMCYEILDEHLLSRVKNLVEVNMIAGNHDRGTGDNKGDVEGLAAQMIAHCLELIGYKINFDSLVLSKEIDGINYVILHGDKMLSRRKTKDITWDHGKQGMFNFVLEGHLHSRTVKVQDFPRITDDAKETRRMVCPSIFTGNRYSEYGGWDALGGYNIIENNGNGKPNVFDFSL